MISTTHGGYGVGAFALSANGTRFAYLNEADQKVIVLDLTGADIVEHTVVSLGKPRLQSLALSPDGKALAVAAGNFPVFEVLMFDISGKISKQTATIKEGAGTHIAFSPDGKRLARGNTGVEVFDLTGPEPKSVYTIPNFGDVGSFAFTAEGKGIVHGSSPVGHVRFWEISGPQPKELEPLDFATASVPSYGISRSVLTGNGLLVALRPDHATQFWDLTGPVTKPISDTSKARGLPFAGAGNQVVLMDGSSGMTPNTICWECQPGQVREMATADEPFVAMSLSTDGKILFAVVDGARGIVSWDLSKANQARKSVPGLEALPDLCTRLELSPTGKILAVLFRNGGVHLYDVSGPKAVKKAEFPFDLTNPTYSILFHPDGALLATTRIHDVVIYNLKGKIPTVLSTFRTSNHFPSAVFHPDGKRLLTANAGGQVAIWDWKTQKIEREWKLPGAVPYAQFSPDDRNILTHNSNGTIYVLRLEPPPAGGPEAPKGN